MVMPVTSVTIPDSGRVGEPVRSTFTGTLAGSCQRFKRLEVMPDGLRFEIAMVAREPLNPRWTCTDEPETVSRSHAFVPRQAGTFVIRVQTSDGEPIERTVVVD